LTSKIGRQNFWPGKSQIFPENRKFVRLEMNISATGFTHDPQTSKQIDAAASYKPEQRASKGQRNAALYSPVVDLNSYCWFKS